MKLHTLFFTIVTGTSFLLSCNSASQKNNKKAEPEMKIIFLHHSTGWNIWNGNPKTIKSFFYRKFKKESAVTNWFRKYNEQNGTNYQITNQPFPKKEPYGWHNYPYDYYNIWVKNAGDEPYMEEPTLEMLTKEYDVIIWKHCYPVGNIKEDTGTPDIDSDEKRIENYKLQYNALKEKMRSFPDNKFIIWTGAALVESWTSPEEAKRTRAFFDWVKSEWDEPEDNIFLWDLYELETEGEPYLKVEYALKPGNPHPNKKFSGIVAPLLCSRVVDIIENNGQKTTLTGVKK